MNRRRIALILLGLLHLSVALQLAAAPPSPGLPDDAIFHTLFPVWLRVSLWAGAGMVATLTGIFGREELGWGVVIVMPLERTISYGWSGLMAVIPGWPPGVLESFGAMLFWGIVTGLISVMASWRTAPNPTDFHRSPPIPEPWEGP